VCAVRGVIGAMAAKCEILKGLSEITKYFVFSTGFGKVEVFILKELKYFRINTCRVGPIIVLRQFLVILCCLWEERDPETGPRRRIVSATD
jgi:hypothetical protein